ncbi:hydrolase, partial [bacterium]|nr:hydrolase [bacterium]
AEVQKLIESNTWLSHQPRSNMNNAVGLGDIDSQLRAGLRVCLGNDGFSNAMWDEWRTCYLAHKGWNRDPRRMGANTIVDMAIYNNSDLASQFFDGQRIGRLEEGAKADLILVDFDPITNLSTDNLPWQIIFGFRDSMVTTTIVNGKVLMKDRELTTIDEKEVNQKARELSKAVWQRYEKQF